MMQTTTHHLLPLILPSQAQKHVTHNEALLQLDAVVQLSVASASLTEPPPTPADGERHIVAAGATGDFTGKDGQIALWQDGIWRFLLPREGWLCWVADSGRFFVRSGGGWEPLSAATEEVVSTSRLGINAAADPGNRLIVCSDTVLFNHEGNDHRLKINKQAPGDTASLLLQTNHSGRAEIGLAGNDALTIKVSANGADWTSALQIDRGTGHVGLGTAPTETLEVAGSILATGSMRAQSFYSGDVLIPDDSAATIPTPSSSGIVIITNQPDSGYPQSSRSGMALFDTGLTPEITRIFGGANFYTMNADVTGTTGTAPGVTLGRIEGALKLENRHGGAMTFRYTFIG